MIYPPREDSLLLAKYVKKLARGRVMDMGTGSGIQALTAAAKKNVSFVLAVDVDDEVVRHCRKNLKSKKIRCLKSDLFASIPRQEFDTIIFNPPYLPQELRERDIALEGGRKGYETIARFLEKAGGYLSPDGVILLLFSSLTNKNRAEQAIRQQLLDFKQLDRIHIFFEDLFVYRIVKSQLLKRIESTGVKSLAYFARGRRSWVFRGKYRGNDCVVKVKRHDSAVNAPALEGKNLAIVNKLGIGPKLFVSGKDFVVYRFVPGEYVSEVMDKASKSTKQAVLRQLFEQAFLLDNAGLAKEEMTRPLKNAIVDPNGRVVLIDFERLHKTAKPHNVTQLCVFASRHLRIPLKAVKHAASHYKHNPSRQNFVALLKEMGL